MGCEAPSDMAGEKLQHQFSRNWLDAHKSHVGYTWKVISLSP